MSENTTTSAAAQLEQLRQLLTDARPVPMSASCMVNRAEALALVETALASLPQELSQARQVLEQSRSEVLRGRDEGDRIRVEAEEWAQQMASQTEVARRAEAQAKKLVDDATAECDALRAETDGYVDTRMAEFEAALAKTAAQVRTMRARLAERLPKDGDDEDSTITLPKL